MVSERVSQHTFFGVSALLFAGSVTLTVLLCGSMSAMGGMPMPGGWTMSMTWMRMPGQSWPGAAAYFVGMWTLMMVAMMLPSLIPSLLRHRKLVAGAGDFRVNWLTTLVLTGYFLVWSAVGLAVFPLGVALAEVEMSSSEIATAVPLLAALTVLIAGAVQFTSWKSRQLQCCREGTYYSCPPRPRGAVSFRYGLSLGVHCCLTCAGFTAVLLALGVMDLRVMTVVTAAITIERLAPESMRAAQAIGIVLLAGGVIMLARAASLL